MPFPLNLSSSYLSHRDCKPQRLGLTPSFIAASLAARVLSFSRALGHFAKKNKRLPRGGGGRSLGISG